MAYTIQRNVNKIDIITNELLYVTVYVQVVCKTDDWEIIQQEVSNSNLIQITLPLKENLYKIYITDKKNQYQDYIVSTYLSHILSLSNSVEKALCECNSGCNDNDDDCEECNDCNNKTQQNYNDALVKLMNYNIVNQNLYNKYFYRTNKCINCDLLNIINVISLSELVSGCSDNNKLIKKIIIYYYLVYYYTDMYFNNNSLDIKNAYKFITISRCIEKYNIDISCISKNIDYENQPPVIGSKTITLPNAQTKVFSDNDFYNTTPKYYDKENDKLSQIRIDSIVLPNGSLFTLNNINITIGQIINFQDVINGNLKYTSPTTQSAVSFSFTWSGKAENSTIFVN